jgi:ABC-type multidrug transport system ATPase subunit
MDEASLCDRIALIQNGSFLTIDSPQNIVNQFPHELWSVSSDTISKLLTDLRKISAIRSSFSFGDSHHVTLKNKDLSIDALKADLEKYGHTSIDIKRIEASIEDCFMDLSNGKLKIDN